MNLEALYELRTRLEDSAIAGIKLLAEDFRLKRAVDKIESYTAVAPVFKQIYDMCLKLTGSADNDGESKAELLLDVLALVDAVLCTQGGFYSIDEKDNLSYIDTSLNSGETFRQFPYSRLKPVIDAFSSQGSGRYAIIANAHEKEPEIFKDFRMKYWMVYALGDSYSETAQMVEGWLKNEGKGICPLLKKDFDPKGKKDMVRRLEIISEISGEEENDFYKSLVHDADAAKEVREAAIHALRYEPANEELLIALTGSEKGKCKEAALASLSHMNGEEAMQCWKKAISKKPEVLSALLHSSTRTWVGVLLGEQIKKQLEKLDSYKNIADNKETSGLKKKDIEILDALWDAFTGKAVPETADYALIAYKYIPQRVVNSLNISMIVNPDKLFFDTAERLYKEYKDACVESAFAADLLTMPAGDVYEKYKEYFNKSIINHIIAVKKDETGIINCFIRLKYDEDKKCYMLACSKRNHYIKTVEKPIFEALDIRWYDLLLNYKNTEAKRYTNGWNLYGNAFYEMAAQLYNPFYEGLNEMYGKFFYNHALRKHATPEHVRLLKRCDWKEYKNILSSLDVSKNSKTANSYYVSELLKELPMSSQELAQELDKLLEKGRDIYVGYRAAWREWSDKLKNGAGLDEILG